MYQIIMLKVNKSWCWSTFWFSFII